MVPEVKAFRRLRCLLPRLDQRDYLAFIGHALLAGSPYQLGLDPVVDTRSRLGCGAAHGL
jgi:hypothetical protein